MTELAFMKYDHSTDSQASQRQLAALYSPFDLIIAKPDGWAWGDAELSNPWFRILRWSSVSLSDVQPFLSPLLPTLDINGVATTYWQSRAFNIDLSDVRIPAAVKNWWNDDTRSNPIFIVPASFAVTPALLKKTRQAIADASYAGASVTKPVIGIGS